MWVCLLAGGAMPVFLGTGTSPHAGAASALRHRPTAQAVLATAMWGPWAGPHARGGELCVPAHPRGLPLTLRPCFCYDLDAGSALRAKEK